MTPTKGDFPRTASLHPGFQAVLFLVFGPWLHNFCLTCWVARYRRQYLSSVAFLVGFVFVYISPPPGNEHFMLLTGTGVIFMIWVTSFALRWELQSSYLGQMSREIKFGVVGTFFLGGAYLNYKLWKVRESMLHDQPMVL